MMLIYNKISRETRCRTLLRVAVVALLPVLAAGCASPTRLDDGAADAGGNRAISAAPRDPMPAFPGAQRDDENREVHTDLIRGMLAQEQYYAALAHIEDQKRVTGSTRELRLLEAETRRKLGQTEAATRLYEGLLDTEFDGPAHHGLGLLLVHTEFDRAVQHLRQAVQRRPTDAQFRNDLGYALMVSGRYKEALPELATAVELDQGGQLSRNNLIMLLVLTHDEARARRVARDSGITDEVFSRLRRDAQSMARNRPKRERDAQ